MPRDELLTFGEIRRIARVATELGVRKIRLTGGEPLLRAKLPRLIGMLRSRPGVDEVALTTNGSRLADMAPALAEAGLSRVTVSLDALDPDIFHAVTDSRDTVDQVLAGIEAAAAAGLRPVKVNSVVRRGVNEDQVIKLASHFKGSGHILRFIEFMDVGETNGWRKDHVVSAEEILSTISAVYPIEAIADDAFGGVAERWRYCDGSGEIGVIASVTKPFCGGCNRARLSSNGQFYTCLFASSGTDMRALLRNDAGDAELRELLGSTWRKRDDRYSEIRSQETGRRHLPRLEMSHIGG